MAPRTAGPSAPPNCRSAVLPAAAMPASFHGTALMAAVETAVSMLAIDRPRMPSRQARSGVLVEASMPASRKTPTAEPASPAASR